MALTDANIQKKGNTVNVTYGSDDGVFAKFYTDAVENPEKTAKEGRPIYDSVDMIEMRFAGNSSKVVVRPVQNDFVGNTPPDSQRFPRQWEAFKNENTEVDEGTILEHWPPLNKAQVLNLKAMNIFTVEQLAGMTDANLKFAGARALRDNAAAWLEEAEAGSGLSRLEDENKKLREENTALKNTLKALQEQADAAEQEKAGADDSDALSSGASEDAAPLPEADVKPIKGKLRSKKVAKNGKNTSPTGSAGGK